MPTIQRAKKECFKCGTVKSIDEFYSHPRMADGHLNKCKACTRNDVTRNYRGDPEGRRDYERERQKRPERRKAALRYQKTRRRRHPDKERARRAVAYALRAGNLQRAPCKCGDPKTQAHHHDYSKPLDVEWLCFRCHRNERHGQQVQKAA